MSIPRSLFTVLSAIAVGGGFVAADPPVGKEDDRFGNEFIDETAAALRERYNLDGGQFEMTRAILGERTKGFRDRQTLIDKAWTEVIKPRPIGNPGDIKEELTQVQRAVDDMRRYAAATGDLFRERVLDARQRETFDADRMGGLKLPAPLGGRGPPHFARSSVLAASPPDHAVLGTEELEWELWLRGAAVRAGMSTEQVAKARKMLVLAKRAAADYRKSKEADFKQVAADLTVLKKFRDADSNLKDSVEKAAVELRTPLLEIGKRWRTDVLNLLNPIQRKAVEGAVPKR